MITEPYTLETLLPGNESYDREHKLTQADVDHANSLRALIESTRDDHQPMPGDVVEVTTEQGDYYNAAHIDSIEPDGRMYVGLVAHTPFLYPDGPAGRTFTMTRGGGPWHYIPRDLKKIGTRLKDFKTWGHRGVQRNGAVRFKALVNVWEYVEGSPEFTTRTHDKFYVFDCTGLPSAPDSIMSYDFEITHFEPFWTTRRLSAREYREWLASVNGIVRDGNDPRKKIVWAPKRET